MAFALVAIAAAATALALWSLPEQIPTHWNIRGEVDGYGGKWTLFIFPVMMVGMLALFYFLPALSPKQFEVDTFSLNVSLYHGSCHRACSPTCTA